MQDYRTLKPHSPAECGQCGPQAPGHRLCQHDGCNEIAEVQYRRHATQAEYDALPESFRPIDGVAHQAVFTCLDHEIDPICGNGEHPVATAPGDVADGCPKCGAAAGNACMKANGKPRSTHHAARRVQTQTAPVAACDHVHREDCGGQGACACFAGDAPPLRQPRIIDPQPLPAPAPIHVPTHGPTQVFLAEHGIDTGRVIALDLIPGADGPVMLRAVLAFLDAQGHHAFNEHGQIRTEVREIHLTPSTSRDVA